MMEWHRLMEDIEDNFIPFGPPPPLDLPLYSPSARYCLIDVQRNTYKPPPRANEDRTQSGGGGTVETKKGKKR
jgi:hypothetical protein